MHSLKPIILINGAIDRLSVPFNVNEQQIDAFLMDLDRSALTYSPVFWLTMARLTEMALLCAGHYADNCEFSAAGDLLFNPRKILVHVPGHDTPLVKLRHGRLTDQLAPFDMADESLKNDNWQIVEPAIVPSLHSRLEQSDFFSVSYVDDIAMRMGRIADTMTFLSSYQISLILDTAGATAVDTWLAVARQMNGTKKWTCVNRSIA